MLHVVNFFFVRVFFFLLFFFLLFTQGQSRGRASPSVWLGGWYPHRMINVNVANFRGKMCRSFFSDLQILASILQAHTCSHSISRGTLRTSQTSDKPPKKKKKKKKKSYFGREILAYQRESVRMWWNVWELAALANMYITCIFFCPHFLQESSSLLPSAHRLEPLVGSWKALVEPTLLKLQ